MPEPVPLFEPPQRTVSEPPEVAAYRRALPDGEAFAYPLDPLDHLGLPVWSAELFTARGTAHHGAGYGESDERAVTGAFGELSETLFAADAVRAMTPRRASYRDLVPEVGREGVIDPLTVCLPAGSGYSPERPLCWVLARRWTTGEPVYVPLELAAASSVDIDWEGELLVQPVTNGLGAGPTVEHAMAHGLLELVQRDGNSVAYRALDQGVVISGLEAVDKPETRALLEKLDRHGIEVVVKLASTDFGINNIYVVGADRDPVRAPHPLALSACGEAADPDREKALSKALMEFCAGRARKPFDNGPLSRMTAVAPATYVGRAIRAATLESEEERATRGAVDWLGLDAYEMRALLEDPVFAARSEVDFSSLPTLPGGAEDSGSPANLVANRLREDGLDPLYVDLSPPGGEVRVVRAIVPGLEVETASYARIGARNLRRLLCRDDDLVGVDEPPPGAKPILLPGQAREEFGPAPWLNVDLLEKRVGRLYPLYREPSRHVAGLVASGVL
ncbi:MAG TPA: YcaO-like family protein [Rubrobacter sp.]|nr:YcaO-like family protein [Rubrobacter sp.]